MRILNFGSINVDHVYQVPHFVRPGETLPASSYHVFPGGKGLNQSVALARAGATVQHAGKIGPDAPWILNILREAGADTSLIKVGDRPTGHAIIQVNPEGQNSIITFAGSNFDIESHEIVGAINQCDPSDFLLLQNEINRIPELIAQARTCGMRVVFNPAPMTPEVNAYPLQEVDYLFVNETEGTALTGFTNPSAIIAALAQRLPQAALVLTLGPRGVIYHSVEKHWEIQAPTVQAIDTTAAGDTFIGYLLAEITRGSSVLQGLNTAMNAAALCVTRQGAANSIPHLHEVKSLGA
jgi:ribokinase